MNVAFNQLELIMQPTLLSIHSSAFLSFSGSGSGFESIPDPAGGLVSVRTHNAPNS